MAKSSRHTISITVNNTQYWTLKRLAKSLNTNTSKLIRSHMFMHHLPRRVSLNHKAIMKISSKIDKLNQLIASLDSQFAAQHRDIDLNLRKKAQTMDKHLELKPLNLARAALTDAHSKQLGHLYDYESNTIAPYLKTIAQRLIDIEALLSHKLTHR